MLLANRLSPHSYAGIGHDKANVLGSSGQFANNIANRGHLHTISQSGVAAHPNGAHVAWAGSNAADIHEAFLSIGCALICFRYLL
jgi:hypothetical protein